MRSLDMLRRANNAAIERLPHASGECTGHWRFVGAGDRAQVRCDGCDARYSATPEIRLAAIDENYAGVYLRRLAAEGVTQLEAERGGGGHT